MKLSSFTLVRNGFRREQILVVLALFTSMKYGIAGILALQKLVMYQQIVEVMVMDILIFESVRLRSPRTTSQF